MTITTVHLENDTAAVVFDANPAVTLTDSEQDIITEHLANMALIVENLDAITAMHDANGETWHLAEDGSYVGADGTYIG